MMIHEASWGVVGKGSNNKSQNDFHVKQTEKLVRKVYEGFITQKEIESVLTGTEFWFDSDEIQSRVDKMLKVKEKSIKKKISKIEE